MKQFSKLVLLLFFLTYSSNVCQPELSIKSNHTQYVILKADDLIYDEKNIISKNWYRFFEYIVSEKIKTSVGIVVNSLDTEDERYPALLKYLHRTVVIEFWNHGFDHRLGAEDDAGNLYDEFRGSSLEFQIEQLKKSQSLAKEKLGITLSAFGAPGNAIDRTTIKALNQFEEIKVWFYGLEGSDKLVLERTADMEYPAGKPDYNSFIKNYDSTKEYLVFQIHPNMWDENQFEEFKKIVSYLKEQKLLFVLPKDYYTIKVSTPVN
jgi:peptidoglycan/xylan/chitin deacetylase (PgdA/CDA1 family)